MSDRVLYLLGSAAPPVLTVASVIERAQTMGWDVCLGLTRAAAGWLSDDLPALERLTGHPVRSAHRSPAEDDPWPKADVVLFAPLTFNSLNAWAAGLTHDFVVGVGVEMPGRGVSTLAMPCINSALMAWPSVERSVATLREGGVDVLLGERGFEPNEPGERRPYPWGRALAAAEAARLS